MLESNHSWDARSILFSKGINLKCRNLRHTYIQSTQLTQIHLPEWRSNRLTWYLAGWLPECVRVSSPKWGTERLNRWLAVWLTVLSEKSHFMIARLSFWQNAQQKVCLKWMTKWLWYSFPVSPLFNSTQNFQLIFKRKFHFILNKLTISNFS